jgi:sulfotransferase famil protein
MPGRGNRRKWAAVLNDVPVIISVHIPKCGGTSFQHVLQDIFGKGRVWLNYTANLSEGRPPATAIPWRTKCIHGHFLSDSFDQAAPQAALITWLRHPVERVVSNYHHFFRHPDPANPTYRELRERNLSLGEFAALPAMRNEASRYLAGKPASAFRFVGITERFDESLEVFGACFGLTLPSRRPRENVNPERLTESYPLPRGLYDQILAMNLQDFSMYHSAAAELDRIIVHRRSQAA